MAKLKRLATKVDPIVRVECPVSKEELDSRQKDYPVLEPLNFAREHDDLLFQPISLTLNGQLHQLQFNYCTNPFCKWFGHPQIRFENVPNKPHRYKTVGSTKHNNQAIACNPDPLNTAYGVSLNCTSTPVSNWSVAEEIVRLKTNDSVVDIEPEYCFHRESCKDSDFNPFDNPETFYRRGESTGHSKKWQCKECRKITNVLPNREESFSYHQQRNDILPIFARLLLNRTPVKRTCEILQISSTTYYNKLEWLFRRCLEFLERYETKALQNHRFKTLWLESDQLIYSLNNVRRKGKGGTNYSSLEEPTFKTYVIVSGEKFSKYIFRSDIAYDWETNTSDLEQDTLKFKDDHLNNYARKNGRFSKYNYYPQPPTQNDTQTQAEYSEALRWIERRKRYVDGLHVNPTYTALAHYWLIKQILKVDEWRLVTDADASLVDAIARIFTPEIIRMDAHHFLCQINKGLTRKQAFKEYTHGRNELRQWGIENGFLKESYWELARLKLREELKSHQFYEFVNVKGHNFPKRPKQPNPIQHPLPSMDEGIRWVDCLTNLSTYPIEELADLILGVNNKSTNNFMQQIRRRISILERPLITASGEGKSYIYANFNPKYAQYALTILRTYFNFCVAYKTGKKNKKRIATPAQRLGITDKQFSLREIIYFK